MWHFIPPFTPHFGGIWKSAVKAMKFHLKRVAETASLNVDEIETLLVQIKAILNSRLLILLSVDSNDSPYPLSPVDWRHSHGSSRTNIVRRKGRSASQMTTY